MKAIKTRPSKLASDLGISRARSAEAIMKAELIGGILRELERKPSTHVELAKRSGLPRSAVTGILSGSLQKITIDRILRLLEAVGLEAQLRIRRAA